MKSEEKDYLMLEKSNNGISREKAYQEIEKLKLSQIKFKTLENENKKKDTIINNLKKQIDKLRAQNFNLQIKIREKPIKIEPKENGCVKYLSRIIDCMEINKKYSTRSLSKELGIPYQDTNIYLNFLKRTNLINLELTGGWYRRI